jgi:hypothetical protein
MELNTFIKKKFPFLNVCLWSTSVYHEFMLHQPAKSFQIIEVEQDARDAIFFLLKESGLDVFLDSDKNYVNRYLPDDTAYWILKSLVSEAPIQVLNTVPTSTLEKSLVDLFAETDLLSLFQGSEKDRIFEEACGKYLINENKLLRYAARRGKKQELNRYLDQVSKFRQ